MKDYSVSNDSIPRYNGPYTSKQQKLREKAYDEALKLQEKISADMQRVAKHKTPYMPNVSGAASDSIFSMSANADLTRLEELGDSILEKKPEKTSE